MLPVKSEKRGTGQGSFQEMKRKAEQQAIARDASSKQAKADVVRPILAATAEEARQLAASEDDVADRTDKEIVDGISVAL